MLPTTTEFQDLGTAFFGRLFVADEAMVSPAGPTLEVDSDVDFIGKGKKGGRDMSGDSSFLGNNRDLEHPQPSV